MDFVQAQIDFPDEKRLMGKINQAYQLKITHLIKNYEGIPRSSIIPIAFSSNGVFHPSSLVFIDWFLCRASREAVNAPPAIEKLKVLQAMSSAIVDQTATILTIHFSKFINELHMKAFPHVLAESTSSGASARLNTKQVRRSLFRSATSSAGAVLNTQSQHPLPARATDVSLDSRISPEAPPLGRSPERPEQLFTGLVAGHEGHRAPLPARSSERLREKFTARGAVGLRGHL